MFKVTPIAAVLSTLLLTACSDSSVDEADKDLEPTTPPPAATEYDHQISGVVAYHELLAGADICVDLNQNQLCDTDEPTSTTDTDGAYQIDWVSETETPEFDLIATWTQAAPAAIAPQKFTFNGAPKLSATAAKIQHMPVVNNDGVGRLLARQAHDGAINYFTNLEHRRWLEAIANDLTEAEVEALFAKLEATLTQLIGEVEVNPYLIANEDYVLSQVPVIEQMVGYLEQIFADIAFEALVLEELLATIFSELNNLVTDSGLTIEEYLANDPLDASFLINNSLTMLGHITNPYDDRIMGSSDWQVIDSNFFSDNEALSNLIGLSVTPTQSFVNVTSEDQMLFGTLSASGFNHFVFGLSASEDPDSPPMGEDGIEECWNATTEAWETEDEQSEEPVAPAINNNSRIAQFMVADASVSFNFSKVDTQSDFWESVLGATPSALKLDELSWPNVVYTFDVEQNKDVMCRIKDDYETYPLDTNALTAADLTTIAIAKSLYPYDDPDLFAVDELNKQFQTPIEEITVSWELIDGPNDSQIIKVEEVVLLPGLQAFANPDFYRVDLGTPDQLEKVDLYRTTDWALSYPQFIYTYDNSNNFTEALFEHLKNL